MNKRITLFLITLLTVCGVQSQNNNQNRNADFHKWAETPPMGWNSWDCFGANVTEAEVKANADYMAEHLKDYGWEYIVVDIRWLWKIRLPVTITSKILNMCSMNTVVICLP